MADRQPKVSVCMITYNHEAFIAQAIESVLEQNTDFDFELVIGEDCSTDNTREIVIKYANQYPEIVKAKLRQSNIGMSPNWVQTMRECKGKYIAFLDGDDYWIDPRKLAIQFQFMENDSDEKFSACFHNNYILQSDGSRKKRFGIPMKSFINQHNLLYSCIPQTNAVFIRAKLIPETLPDWFMGPLGGDWGLHIMLTNHGDYGYIDRVMSVYRIQMGGICTKIGMKDRGLGIINRMHIFNRFLRYKYNDKIKWGIARLAAKVACWAECESDWKTMKIAAFELLRNMKYNRKIPRIFIFKITAKAFFPQLRAFKIYKQKILP